MRLGAVVDFRTAAVAKFDLVEAPLTTLGGMDAPAGLPPLAAILGSLKRGQTVHYVHVASACLFYLQAYDHLTTFSDELELIWRAPWSVGKIFFLASRYIAWPEFIISLYIELFNVPEGRCYSGFVYITWSIVAGITVSLYNFGGGRDSCQMSRRCHGSYFERAYART
ncbi:hypothetical protein AURDEDRAFT_172151 [Auricularia subglabra TFB-10046 SS5]|nr:hypothetical protein AURDEDRAFT_172151 [Auricularia subglabra TFB-10046 SS5]